jgi:hypothetical protein
MADVQDRFDERFARELKALFAAPQAGAAMRAQRDNAILQAARLAGDEELRWRWRRRVAWAIGMAAALAVAAGLGVEFWPGGSGSGGGRRMAEVVARTGDIRDAFYVARELKAQKALDGTWDANGDGVVDENDVRVLAVAAVSVRDAKGVRP